MPEIGIEIGIGLMTRQHKLDKAVVAGWAILPFNKKISALDTLRPFR